MTRKSWTDETQLAWLQERNASFLEAFKNKTLKEFFHKTVQGFREIWPVDPTTNEEIAKATSAEEANKKKRRKYDQVWRSSLLLKK
jgi:hypothetical protein